MANEPIEINLGNDLFAWISPEDIDLCEFEWSAKKAGRKEIPHYYAVRYINAYRQRQQEIYLHNEVWESVNGVPLPEGFLVDHINGDKLDNRRENIRLATRAENEINKLKRRTHKGRAPTSKYKGVCINPGRKKCWRAMISVEDKTEFIGSFYTEEEAALAYNVRAKELYGEFAVMNKIQKKKEKK